ncbi:hypothetical protein WOA01_21130 [Methylocystis sp. IM2]|uniref:hypothetical protein n=1 Tax=Methylocystis sp. IM2 TaxID=3136563 RepID=UPI0030FC675D
MGIATALSLGATGLAAFGSYEQRRTAASNMRQQGKDTAISRFYDSQQAALAAQVGELRATQTGLYMRRQQEGVMANIDAVSALSGAADDSPSTWAVRNRYQNLSDEARVNATTNIRLDAQAKRNAAMLYQLSGMRAMSLADQNANNLEMNGLLSAGGGLLKALNGMFAQPDPCARY